MMRIRNLFKWATPLLLLSLLGVAHATADDRDFKAAVTAPQAPVRRVNNADDFIHAMELHRERVKTLATDIYRRYPGRFAPLTEAQLVQYIEEIHDAGKLQPPMAERMVQYWGTRIGKIADPVKKNAGFALIDELNAHEKKDASDFFQRNHWSAEAKQECKTVETLADSLDRGLAPLSLEEFGETRMIPASQFAQDPVIARNKDILLKYEAGDGSLYKTVTRGRHFHERPIKGTRAKTPPQLPLPIAPKHPPGRVSCAAEILAAVTSAKTALIFREAASLRPMINRLSAVRDPESFAQSLQRRADLLTQAAKTARNMDTGTAERFYKAIRDQIPKEGYIRALSAQEVHTILKEGKMGRGYDFTFRNSGARVGHSSNFIFLRCRNCPPDAFKPGVLGSGVVNQQQIPLDQLEFIIPDLPIQMK